MTSVAEVRVLPEALPDTLGEVAGRLEVSVPRPGPGEAGLGKAPWVWARCQVEDDEVVVRLGMAQGACDPGHAPAPPRLDRPRRP